MILIMGCTASGKSRLAFEIAQRLGGEILSVDSMKVYRRMDIGTAKPDQSRQTKIPHHLIDVVEPQDSFSLGDYIAQAEKVIDYLQQAQRPIIAAGGTGMYLKGLLQGILSSPPANEPLRLELTEASQKYGSNHLHKKLQSIDPESGQRIHPNDLKRIIRALEFYESTGETISSLQQQFDQVQYRYSWIAIELQRVKEDDSHRINQRVKRMIDDGLVDEVESLMNEGLSSQASQAVGYAEIIKYLEGHWTLDDAIEKIKINTRRLAKHQRTWFRSFRRAMRIEVAADEAVESVTARFMTCIEGYMAEKGG